MRRFLIYTSAGKHNNVHHWVNTRERSYDIWVTNYSDKPGLLKDVADFYSERKGAKFPNLLEVILNHRKQIEQYQAIMIADDDIIISPKKLERLFSQLVAQDLWIITPAFSRIGKITHDTTERKLTSRYRYTNFAEVTCPIFRTDRLLEFMDTYDAEVTCFGVDWWYLNFLNDTSHQKLVISDENYCINPRDAQKNTKVREIDKYISHDGRVLHWERKKEELGISSFEKVVYRSVERPLHEVILASPFFAFEILFDRALKLRLLSPIKRVARKVVSVFKRGA